LVTTTSALGRSSIYNRLSYRGQPVFQSVGYTEGYGHFQFSSDLFRALWRYLASIKEVRGHKFGDGPNWRIRTLRSALEAIELNPELLRHGIAREVLLAPLASNWRPFLLGETDNARWRPYTVARMAAHYRQRWGVPRSLRDDRFRFRTRDQLRVSDDLP
jgi:hypothetical protein